MVYQFGTDMHPEIRMYQIPNCFSTKYQTHKKQALFLYRHGIHVHRLFIHRH